MNKAFDIIGAPFNRVGFVTTDENTVDGLRKTDEKTWNGLTEWIDVRNQRWSCDIKDLGDVPLSLKVEEYLSHNKKELALLEYSTDLKNKVLDSYRNKRIPIIIGGDHSVSVGTVQATLEYYQKERKEKVAVVWIDAHADCNGSLQSNLHGKPLALLMDKYGYNGWFVEPELVLSPDDIYYVAVRDLMPNEAELIDELDISNYDMEAIDNLGFNTVLDQLMTELNGKYDRFFVSFDYDCLDGALFRACATPNVGGLSAREGLTLVKNLASNAKFVGIDFLEYMPELDESGVSKELMIKLIDAVWGFRS
ncbi:arginase family protein [Aliivibrio logei]|uniref:Arginase n=1 Tax=Aliivibrio logei 5S-186 TaxID=626086 RepID=A0ABX3ARJ8_ALILO|nr:arginase family protein [Aliivibrio logei]OEF10748.1 arginase [Aliivibrio logei 5S-186]